jgi:hypothetical protein
MESLMSERGSWLPSPPEDWRRSFARRPTRSDPAASLLIAGVVVVGVGLLAWHYLGPDLKRYLKIQNM